MAERAPSVECVPLSAHRDSGSGGAMARETVASHSAKCDTSTSPKKKKTPDSAVYGPIGMEQRWPGGGGTHFTGCPVRVDERRAHTETHERKERIFSSENIVYLLSFAM